MALRLFFLAIVAFLLHPLDAGLCCETATLKGKFVLDGPVPTPKKIKANKDPEVCCHQELFDESLVVAKDGGIKNVFVWLVGPKDKLSGGKPPEKPVVMEMRNCRFVPHVVMMQAGQTLQFISVDDSIGHNPELSTRSNPQFGSTIPVGPITTLKLKKPERLPCDVKCGIHPWMKGYVMVIEGPFGAISAPDGRFEIKGLTTGTPLEFQVWQERGGYIRDVTLAGKKTTWNQGRFTMKLKSGANDMGSIKATIGGQ